MTTVGDVVDWLQEKIEADPEHTISISGVCDEVEPLFGPEFVTETDAGGHTLSERVKRAFKQRMGDRIRVGRDVSGGAIWILQG